MTQTNEALDRFMAEEVMGWSICGESKNACYCKGAGHNYAHVSFNEWHPTTDIAQAMECAEKSEIQFELFTGWGGWHGSFRKFHEKSQNVRKWDFGHVKLEQLPRAICLALYEAKGGE